MRITVYAGVMVTNSRTPDDLVLDAVVRLSFEVVATLTQVGSAHDLSLTQLRLLAILRDHEPSMAQLADHLGLERPTVSGLVDRASARGLVLRTASDVDRRSSTVALTASGRRLAARLERDVAARLRPGSETMTRQEQDTFVRLLGLTRVSLRSGPTASRTARGR